MTQQPKSTEYTTDIQGNETVAAMLVATAEQAVIPRRLEEGIYAIRNAYGAIEIVETDGYTQKVADERAHRPRVVARTVTLIDPASLLDYIHENTADGGSHCAGDTFGSLEVWGDIDAAWVTAILDGYDGWRKHTATLQLKPSREWGEWAAIDGKMLDQDKFADFIDSHLSTIAHPDGAQLLDICQTLTGHTNMRWRSQKILANGQRQFQWEEEIEAKAGQKGDLTIPSELTLALRPYQGSDQVGVTARFRYQLRGGDLLIGVKLVEPDRVLELAFHTVCAAVQAGLPDGITIRHGRS